MTQEQLAELPGVPTWLGMPMYPGGLPMNQDQVYYGDKTIREIYFKRIDDISERKVPPNFDEENILKNFVLYHIHAPIFHSEYLQELLDMDFDDMDLDSLIWKCMDYGIDPL